MWGLWTNDWCPVPVCARTKGSNTKRNAFKRRFIMRCPWGFTGYHLRIWGFESGPKNFTQVAQTLLKVADNIKNCPAAENSRLSSFLAALDVFLVAKQFSLAKTCPKLQKLLKSCRTRSFLLMQLTEQSVHCHWTSLRTAFIIRCNLFLLFIGQKPTTWPANNCLQLMVCLCAMSSNRVWLQIIFCSCVNKTVTKPLFSSCDCSCVKSCRSLGKTW